MEKSCPTLLFFEKNEPPNTTELKTVLQTGSLEDKTAALKKIILLIIHGEKLNQLLMPIIQHLVPLKDHTIKRLLLNFWEVIEKKTPDGKLLPEMILVCNFLRNDLNHPNEYIRGITLRYICKLKERELLEPLLPSVRSNLEHRFSYVRKNAVLALASIYKEFENLAPDAPELIYNLLRTESDPSTKRNCFMMLFNCAQEKAIEYLSTVLDKVEMFPDNLQLVIVELIRKMWRTNPSEKSNYLRCIFSLLSSPSPAVQFESAGSLISLSSAAPAIKAATNTYINLLCGQSDNNVKMIVLDKLLEIKKNHSRILQDLLLDVLRALSCPHLEIRKKTLDLAMDLISPRNIEEIVQVLKKEINRTQSQDEDKAGEYRQLLVQAIHTCSIKFPSVATSVVHILMDFLGDSTTASAIEVILFIREVIQMYPDLRHSILKKLLQSLNQIRSSEVFRTALWIIGEYCLSAGEIDTAFGHIKESLGEMPFLDKESTEVTIENPEKKLHMISSQTSSTKLLPDGTYASQSIFTQQEQKQIRTESKEVVTLRSLILGGDFFVASSIASCLTKLVLRLIEIKSIDITLKNTFQAEVLLILVRMLRLGENINVSSSVGQDCFEQISFCFRVLTESKPELIQLFLTECRKSLISMLEELREDASKLIEQGPKEVSVQPDDLLKIRQLKSVKGSDTVEEEDIDLDKATGMTEKDDSENKLNRVVQLTGFSDALYAEVYVLVHQYDILLDVFVMNQTPDTLQNVSLELTTLGDLKLCERPQNYTIGPHSKCNIRANIKVSSTETGIIFGTIVYDIAGKAAVSDRNVVFLNDIHIDIIDYISPATISETSFRSMWIEFEWENKVIINTSITDVQEFLDHILKSTNMRSLTKRVSEDKCGFLAANLYAKSIFGEDALANLCVEKQADGKLGGHIRIRSKTQGIALSLGDKINMKQQSISA